jgi:DNA-binding transcriptional ArsR family regulator
LAERTHQIFAALANPQRLAILIYLVEQGGRSVSQSEILAIDKLQGLGQPTVSLYLKTLGQEGLVVKGPGKRGTYTVPMLREVGELILIVASIGASSSELSAAESNALARRVRKARMAKSPFVEKDTA